MTATLLWGLLGSVILGALFVVFGWRGKRLNDHPICRSCRFDLLGTLPDGVTCPECGAGLKRPKAYRVGARQKRWIVVAVGALMILFPMGTIGTVGFGVLTGKDFNTYKPTWLLIWEGKNLGEGPSQLAATELEARAFSSETDPEVVATIVQAALDIQGNAGQPWDETWGDIITSAMASGTLSDDDSKRYMDQGIAVELDARLRVSAGGSLPVVLKPIDGRIASSSMLMGMVFLDECTLDGTALKQKLPDGVPTFASVEGFANLGWIQVYGAGSWGGGGSTMLSGQAVTSLVVPSDVAPGRHTVRVAMAIQMVDQQAMQGGTYTWPTEADENSRMVEGEFEIEVVAEGASTVLAVAATPEMTTRMTDAVMIGSIEVYPGGLLSSGQANMAVTFAEPPESLACDVIVQQGDREWAFGSLSTGTLASQNMGGGGWYQQDDSTVYVSGVLPRLKSGAVSVILRPSAKVAAQTIDVTRYYGGEIVIDEVAVERYGSSGGFIGALFDAFSQQAALKAAQDAEAEGEETPDGEPAGNEPKTPDEATGGGSGGG